MTAVQQRRGVYQADNGRWTWYDPVTGTQGEELPSRSDARTAYQEFRKKQPAPSGAVAGSITPTQLTTEDQVLDEVVARAKPVKKAAIKATKRTTPKRARTPGSVAKAWSIFNRMPKAKRKDVLAMCEKAGLNINTAKTQYQRWLHRDQAGK